ncbi:MAG: hypothetical protein R2939_09105 [Kofleriaceae bacterium]
MSCGAGRYGLFAGALLACGGGNDGLSDARVLRDGNLSDAAAPDAGAAPDAAPPPGWRAASPTPLSPLWLSGAMAVDLGRDEFVYFGGYEGYGPSTPARDDTWVWSAGQWSLAAPAARPPARAQHCLAFDGTNVIAFGGVGAAGNLGDTWSWDGATWQERQVAGPAAGIPGACAWDPVRAEVVLFGPAATDETWRWDGAAWSMAISATKPAAGTLGEMAADPVTTDLVLLTNSGETWRWNGAGWTQVVPGSTPTGPQDGCLYADAALGQMVLLGGQAGPTILDEVWSWDGATWSALPARRLPSPRRYATCATIPGSTDAWLEGGSWFDADALSLRWNGAAWVEVAAPLSPSHRQTAYGAFDAARGEVVLLGEFTVATWVRGAAGWRRAAAPLPAGSGAPALAWDPGRGRVVMVRAEGGSLATWSWNGTAWLAEAPLASPPGRSNAALAALGDAGLILFGGDDGTFRGDTWRWDGTTWIELAPAIAPPGRAGGRLAFDPARDRLVLWGGTDGGGPRQDLWEFDGATWIAATPAVTPTAAALTTLVTAPDGVGVIAVGTVDTGDPSAMPVWRWDGAAWTEITGLGTSADAAPAVRDRHRHRARRDRDLRRLAAVAVPLHERHVGRAASLAAALG